MRVKPSSWLRLSPGAVQGPCALGMISRTRPCSSNPPLHKSSVTALHYLSCFHSEHLHWDPSPASGEYHKSLACPKECAKQPWLVWEGEVIMHLMNSSGRGRE